jgi:hypothetical protein
MPHFGFFVEKGGSIRPFGDRTQPRLPLVSDEVVAGASGRYFVYEGASGLLMTLDSLGVPLFPTRRIPDWLYQALRESFERMAARSTKAPPLTGASPTAKFLTALPDGRVLMFYVEMTHPEVGFAVCYDPVSGVFTRLRVSGDSLADDLLMRAGTAATDGRYLLIGTTRTTAMFEMVP